MTELFVRLDHQVVGLAQPDSAGSCAAATTDRRGGLLTLLDAPPGPLAALVLSVASQPPFLSRYPGPSRR
jgi:hypothetical protein